MAIAEPAREHLLELLETAKTDLLRGELLPMEILFMNKDAVSSMEVERLSGRRDIETLRNSIKFIVKENTPCAVFLVALAAYGRHKNFVGGTGKPRKGEGCIMAAGTWPGAPTETWVALLPYKKHNSDLVFITPPKDPQNLAVPILEDIWDGVLPESFSLDRVVAAQQQN